MLIEMDELTRRAQAERLANEIALLSAHITVATARLLELIRDSMPSAAGPTASSRAPTG